MIEEKLRLRKWGNSFGMIVPQRVIETVGVKEGEKISVIFKEEKNNVLRETFGTLKSKISTQKIMREIDEDLDIEI